MEVVAIEQTHAAMHQNRTGGDDHIILDAQKPLYACSHPTLFILCILAGELVVLSVASHSMIGTLLTVDEVAQWVVHAAQLPKEVADTFRSNRVTGYDFPGLIENQVRDASLTMGM